MKNKKTIIAIVLLMLIVSILSAFPGEFIVSWLKSNAIFLVNAKSNLDNFLGIDIQFSLVQNMMHIPAFGLISCLWAVFFFEDKKWPFRKAVFYAFVLTMIFGVLDEAHQFFVYGRDASFMDLILDLSGALIGIGIFNIKYNVWQTVNSKNKG